MEYQRLQRTQKNTAKLYSLVLTRMKESELRQIGLLPKDAVGKVVYRSEGCENCNYTGYRGRKGAFELMEMTAEIRELAFRKRPTNEVRKEAIRSGMVSLQQDAAATNGNTRLRARRVLRRVMRGRS